MNFERRSTLNMIHFYKEQFLKLPCQRDDLEFSDGILVKMKDQNVIEYKWTKYNPHFILTDMGRKLLREVQEW